VGWYEWNGNFRDLWREFVNYDGTYLPSGWSPPAPNWLLSSTEYKVDTGGTLTGSYNIYAGNGRKPYHSVNFITIHDGFTMYDLLSYDVKENLCGPLDQICCNNPTSPFCDPNSGDNNNRSRNWGQNAEPYKRQLMRDFFMAMMISEGTPLLLGGDEWMRTQLGNNNAYSDSADNSYNWYDWGTWEASDFRNRMHDFVKKAIQFRRSHTYAFVAADWGGTAPFAWEDENGNSPPNWGSRHLAMHFTDASKGPPLLVLLNMELGPVDYKLPAGTWARLIDTQSYFETTVCPGSTATADPLVSQNITLDAPCAVATGDYSVPSRTIVVLQAQ
jgi:glycogen operon protein